MDQFREPDEQRSSRLDSLSLSRRDLIWLGGAVAAVVVAAVVIITTLIGGGGPGTAEIESTSDLHVAIAEAFGVDGLDEAGASEALALLGELLVPRGAEIGTVDEALAALAARLGPEFAGATADELIAALVARVDPDGEIESLDELLAAVTTWAQGTVVVVGSPEFVGDGLPLNGAFEPIADAVDAGRVVLTLPFPGVPETELWRADVRTDRATRTLSLTAEADYLGLGGTADLSASWSGATPAVILGFLLDEAPLSAVTPAWPASAPSLVLEDVAIALSTGQATWPSSRGVRYEVAPGANLFARADLTAVPAIQDLLGVVGITADSADVSGSLGPDGGFLGDGGTSIEVTVALEGVTAPAPWVTARSSSLVFTADSTGAEAVFEDVLDVSIGGARQILFGSLGLSTGDAGDRVDIAYRINGAWAEPFGVEWLTLNNVGLEASFTSDGLDSAIVGGGFQLAGKTGRVAIAVDDAGHATASGTLNDLSLSDVVAAVRTVAGVDLLPDGVDLPADVLGLENISVSFSTGDDTEFALAATTVVAGLRADALVNITSGPDGPVSFFAFNPGGIGLGDIVPALEGDAVADLLTLPDSVFTLASAEATLESGAMPSTVRGFFDRAYATDDYTLDLAPGLNLGGTIPGVGSGNLVGDFMELLGMDPSDPLTMRGSVPLAFLGGGGDLRSFSVQALLPDMSPAGSPEWFESARLGIEVTGAPSVAIVGELTLDIDGDIQTFEIDAAIGAAPGGVAASLTGSLGNPWVSPFDVEWLTLNDVTLNLGFDATGSAIIGFGADLVVGDKDIAGAISVSVNATGVPTNFAFQGSSDSGVGLGDVADLYAAISGEQRPPVEQVLPEIEVREIAVRFAPRPVPELDIEAGFALAGELWVASSVGGPLQRFVGVDMDVGLDGIFAAGFLGAYELGPLAWEDASVALEVSTGNQMFALSGSLELFEASQAIDLFISRTEMAFTSETTIVGFEASLDVAASYDLLDPSFQVSATMSTEFESALTSSSTKEVRAIRQAVSDSIAAWRSARSDAQDTIDDALELIDGAVPSNCNVLVLNALINACKAYHQAIDDIRDLNRKIDDALDLLAEIPSAVTVTSATFTAGFEGFQGGQVSMTIRGTAAGRNFAVTAPWDFGKTLTENTEVFVDLLI